MGNTRINTNCLHLWSIFHLLSAYSDILRLHASPFRGTGGEGLLEEPAFNLRREVPAGHCAVVTGIRVTGKFSATLCSTGPIDPDLSVVLKSCRLVVLFPPLIGD